MVLPLFCLFQLIMDARNGFNEDWAMPRVVVVLLDAMLLVASPLARWLPTHTLRSDAGFVVTLSAYSQLVRTVLPSVPPFELFHVLLLCFCGVHSLPTLVYGCVSVLQICLVSVVSADVICLFILMHILSCRNDYTAAFMWTEVLDHSSALESLLDHASDGFCAIDPNSGVIESASTHLQHLFEKENLAGATLSDFIQECDCHQLHSMYDDGPAQSRAKPILVTCKIRQPLSGFALFDAKIIPYKSATDRANVCIQVKGERRLIDDSEDTDIVAQPSVLEIEADVESSFRYSSSSQKGEKAISFNVTERRPGAQLVEEGVQTEVHEPCTKSHHPCGLPKLPRSPGTLRSMSSKSGSEAASTGIRRRGRATHQGCANSGSERNARVDFAPHLTLFEVTSTYTCIETAKWLFKHWNLPSARSSCCPWHACLEVTMCLLRSELQSPCAPLWSPLGGWQCLDCLGMNMEEATSCQLCFRAAPGAAINVGVGIPVMSDGDTSAATDTESSNGIAVVMSE